MREKKYRVWDEEHHTMLYFTLMDVVYEMGSWAAGSLSIKEQIGEELDRVRKMVIKKMPVMNATGLTDKHGKDIYEGDIVKAKRPWDDWGDTLQVVKYEQGTWNYSYDLHEYAANPEKDWEVVGNRYEHPELLAQVSNRDDLKLNEEEKGKEL